MRILESAARTHQGPNREFNEDAVLCLPAARLVAVADGAGGAGYGNIAATLALGHLEQHAASLGEVMASMNDEDYASRRRLAASNALEVVFWAAHEAIAHAAKSRSKVDQMASACCAALIGDHRALIAHVGDSRAYLFREGRLQAATEDHTVAMLRFRQGTLSEEAYETSPLRRQLYQALGISRGLDVDIGEVRLADRDVLLLCTDGVHRTLSDARIAQILADAPSAQYAANALIDAACEAGTDDNVSVVVVKVSTSEAADRIEDLTRTLRLTHLFRDLSEPDRAIVAPYLEHRALAKGESLFREGDPGASFFCVLSGALDITRGGLHLTTVTQGGHLGELTLARPEARSASAVANQPTLTVELTRERFHEILRRRPNIGAKVALAALDGIGGRLRELTERLVDVSAANERSERSEP